MRFCTPCEQNLINVCWDEVLSNKSYVERNEAHSYAHYTPSVRLRLLRQLNKKGIYSAMSTFPELFIKEDIW
jgi:hypothetical protein